MRRRALLGPPPAPFGWRPVMLAAIAYAVILAAVVVWRAESGTDFRDFWRTAGHFYATGEIRADFGVHNYLPFFVIFMTPWSLLPLPVAAAAFTLLSLALFGLTVALVERILTGGGSPAPRRSTLLAVGLVLPYVHATAVLGQVNLLLLFLVVAAWFLAERGREWGAGAFLGLAALVKLLPALLILYFALRGRWRVAVAATLVAFALGAGLPLLALGGAETVRQHRLFFDNAVVSHSALNTLTAEKPIKAKYSNSAVPMVMRRLLSPVNGDPHTDGRTLFVNVADLHGPVLVALYATFIVVVAGGAVLFTVRGRRANGSGAGMDAGALLFALWCGLMLLMSPLVWTHYLVLAYPCLAALAHRLEVCRREQGRNCRVAAAALGAWALAALLLAWPAARAAGATIAGVLAVELALAHLLFHGFRPRPPRAGTER
jgi:hypothetical protein